MLRVKRTKRTKRTKRRYTRRIKRKRMQRGGSLEEIKEIEQLISESNPTTEETEAHRIIKAVYKKHQDYDEAVRLHSAADTDYEAAKSNYYNNFKNDEKWSYKLFKSVRVKSENNKQIDEKNMDRAKEILSSQSRMMDRKMYDLMLKIKEAVQELILFTSDNRSHPNIDNYNKLLKHYTAFISNYNKSNNKSDLMKVFEDNRY